MHDPDQAQRQLTRLTTTTLLHRRSPSSSRPPPSTASCTWWFTHFAVTDTELRIRTGLVFRRTAHIRLERIQAVDITQPLLARVAGVAKLKLDVVGTDKKDELAFLGRGRGACAARRTPRARGRFRARDGARGRRGTRPGELLRVPPRVLAALAAC